MTGIGFVTLAYWKPWWVAGIVLFFGIAYVMGMPGERRARGRLDRLAASRADHTICAFAREFNCREIDMWIIRAVWDQLQYPYFPRKDRFPLRRTDRLREDLHLDGDDVDEIGTEIAERTGRSWDGAERNPLYGRVFTVGDLIEFFSLQPVRDRDLLIQQTDHTASR